MTDRYVTTSIPYVNGVPHLGHALELVQADVLARAARERGERVRLQSGTDDNALKNVVAAEQAGRAPREYVDAMTPRFSELAELLDLSLDSFVRTSADPRHRVACAAIWRACAERGDLYRRAYVGQYCPGCEAFYAEPDLLAGVCPEHGVVPVTVREENWFFRLSRYADSLRDLIGTDRIRITPVSRKREVLALIRAGLRDFSVSRDAGRSRGWGIPVPGDPGHDLCVVRRVGQRTCPPALGLRRIWVDRRPCDSRAISPPAPERPYRRRPRHPDLRYACDGARSRCRSTGRR